MAKQSMIEIRDRIRELRRVPASNLIPHVKKIGAGLNAHKVRENEFRAKCPVHQGKANTSLSIKNAGDRVLIYCHAGCSLQSILEALGMKSTVELFESTLKPDPETERIPLQRRL